MSSRRLLYPTCRVARRADDNRDLLVVFIGLLELINSVSETDFLGVRVTQQNLPPSSSVSSFVEWGPSVLFLVITNSNSQFSCRNMNITLELTNLVSTDYIIYTNTDMMSVGNNKMI